MEFYSEFLILLLNMGAGSSKVYDEFKVVIVGAGYAGITLASELIDVCNIILISPEDFFMHSAGSPRAAVEPDFVKRILIPLKTTFNNSFIQAKVVEINRKSHFVVLDSGETVEYTHLVIATGTSGPFPFRLCTQYPKISLHRSFHVFQNLVSQVEKAERISCIGGGAVGVELAGEIQYRYPRKKVTLIHSSETLCTSRLKISAQSRLQSCIRRSGINLVLEEKVSNLNDLRFNEFVKNQTIEAESGKTWQSDLVFNCIGAKPASDMFRESLGDAAITTLGRIIVDDYFVVKGTENIFAIGDITDISEEKMVVTAQAHAMLLAKNIKASFTNNKLTAYKPGTFVMILPVGKDSGVSQLYGMVFGDFITSAIKGRGLFVDKMWKLLKQDPNDPNTSVST